VFLQNRSSDFLRFKKFPAKNGTPTFCIRKQRANIDSSFNGLPPRSKRLGLTDVVVVTNPSNITRKKGPRQGF
jgi:hypothetical protein